MLLAFIATCFVLSEGKAQWSKEVYFLISLTLCLVTLNHLVSAFEWFLMSEILDDWSKFLRLMIPIFWGMAAYAWLDMENRTSLKSQYEELERSQKLLDEKDQRINTLINNVSGVVYRCKYKMDWEILFISDKCEQLTGYKAAQLINNAGVAYGNIIHPDDREIVWKTVSEAVSRHKPFEIEYRIITLSGQIKQVREQGNAVKNDMETPEELEGYIQDITQLHQLSRKLYRQKTYDELTGVFNARTFQKKLKRATEDVRKNKTTHVLFLIDLDRFSIINESCGIMSGDDLLRKVADIIRYGIRAEDEVGRISGDKFVVLLKNFDLEQARAIAENIREQISALEYEWDEHRFTLTGSIGMVLISKEKSDAIKLLAHANELCNVAKQRGRNLTCDERQTDSHDMVTKRRNEIQGIAIINDALKNNRFFLCYQPIIPITSKNRELHFEILVRMEGEQGQILPPGVFIHIAEQYGLAGKLDSWIINNTLDWLQDNPRITDMVRTCSINLSGDSIADEKFLHSTLGRLGTSGIDPEKICFEITETAAIADLTSARRFINTLKGLGCRFALDDFGSGLSSFVYLKNLDVDYLKIDGEFVRDITNDNFNYETVSAINRIGKATGKTTIAEFVEDEKTHSVLKTIGVDFGQGYYYARPERLDTLHKNIFISTTDQADEPLLLSSSA